MKVYGQSFLVEPNTWPYPTKAQTWNSVTEAKRSFEEFIQDCYNFGHTPCDHWLYIGEPDGDEEKYGYPNYPDKILKVGPKGGVIVRNV